MAQLRVREARVTPVAVKDPPLLNAAGVHQPYALRAVIELYTDEGLVGLGETYGDEPTLTRVRAVAAHLPGHDPFDIHGLEKIVRQALGQAGAGTPTELAGAATEEKSLAIALAAFEVPCLDLQGKATGRPVSDLLGGAVRDSVPFSAYLFYKWAAHPVDPGYPPDDWGEAADPPGIVEQARHMVDRYGFQSLKLKGGVYPPREEIEAVLALRDAFPRHAIRIDPNANWSVATAKQVAIDLDGVLEYLEDPVDGLADMAEVARTSPMPLATNMCVTTFADIPEAISRHSVQIVLADHHFWGGLRESERLAGICKTFGLGVSMHSNSHLGISLAAMAHLAASTPVLTYACDTHMPWQVEDVVVPGPLQFRDGALSVPRGPGLGVELDPEAVARLNEQYEQCGIRNRDDLRAMALVDPSWTGKRPRF